MKKYKVYYTYTKQSAVIVEANSQEEAEDKFWDNDIVEDSEEDIINTEDDQFIEEIEELPNKEELTQEGTQTYETTLP